MGDEIECELVAVAVQELSRLGSVVGRRHAEHVLQHDRADPLPQLGGIAQAVQDARGDLGADLLVAALSQLRLRVEVQATVGPCQADVRLPEIVQKRREPHPQRRAGVGGRLNHLEGVLVERQIVIAALLVEPDRGLHLRQQVDEHAGVAGEPQRLRRLRAQQELRELAHPVRGQPAADPLARDMLDLRRPLAHLAQRVLVGIDIELRDEAQPAHDPQWVVPKARRAGRTEDPALEIGPAAERIEHLTGLEPARDRIDREVAPLHVLLERDARVRDDLEVVPAGAG